MRQVGPAQHELRRRRGHRRPHVDQVQLRVEAGHHPGAHVPPLLEGHVAPGLVARLAGGRDHPRAPQLGAGARVVGRDDARLRTALGHAAAPGDDLAVRDDRARGLVGRVLAVVEDLRLPSQPARRRVEGEHVVVVARVDDQVVVDGKVPVALGEDADDELLEVVRPRAAVLPDEIAGDGVDGLDDVARVRHVQHAAVGQRCALLAAAAPYRARPDHTQVAHVAAVDLVERAVAPAVERAAPHEPVARGGILQHRVGDRCDGSARLGLRRGRPGDQQHGGRQSKQTTCSRAPSAHRALLPAGFRGPAPPLRARQLAALVRAPPAPP